MKRLLACLAMHGLVGCGEPELCDTAAASFAVPREASVRFSITLRTRGRHDGDASYRGSFAYTAEPTDPVAFAVVGAGSSGPGSFSGELRVDARDDQSRSELVLQRLDETDVLVEGELSADAFAVDGCAIDLEVVSD